VEECEKWVPQENGVYCQAPCQILYWTELTANFPELTKYLKLNFTLYSVNWILTLLTSFLRFQKTKSYSQSTWQAFLQLYFVNWILTLLTSSLRFLKTKSYSQSTWQAFLQLYFVNWILTLLTSSLRFLKTKSYSQSTWQAFLQLQLLTH
jgi:hypothetical protein